MADQIKQAWDCQGKIGGRDKMLVGFWVEWSLRPSLAIGFRRWRTGARKSRFSRG